VARQKLGQHFLASSKVLSRVTDAVMAGGGESPSLVVEIGPGKGALTEYLLQKFDRVIALELDHELVAELRSRWDGDGRLEVIEGNALNVEWSRWGGGVLAGNLPYYVATALISHYLRKPGELKHGVFLIQKEVAARIAAVPGTRDYGYFSVECQFLSRPEYLFTVPPGAFRPPPQVESAVIRVTPKPTPEGIDVEGFLRFASICFRQKRKTLRNNLSSAWDRAQLPDDPELSKRAEQLSVADLIRIYTGLSVRDAALPPEPVHQDAGEPGTR